MPARPHQARHSNRTATSHGAASTADTTQKSWWSGTADDRAVFVQVQMAPPKYWSKPKAPEYQDLTGIGKEAYAGPGMIAGFEATALTDDAVIAVSVAGTKQSADLAADLLRTTLERL